MARGYGKHLARTRWGSIDLRSHAHVGRSEGTGGDGTGVPGTRRGSLLSRLPPMGAGEVITLQFGGFANFVGAHYWNIQARLYTVTILVLHTNNVCTGLQHCIASLGIPMSA